MKKLMRVLIGYDGSSSCDEALNGLSEAGLPARLEAVVLSAADDVLPAAVKGFGLTGLSPQQMESWSHQSVKHARALADGAVKRIKAVFPSWSVRAEAQAESPVHAIVNKARRWKADLIVMGAHGHSQIGRFMGSVSQLVLTQAPCSVRIGRSRQEESRSKIKIMIAVDRSPGTQSAVESVKSRQWPGRRHIRIVSVLRHRLVEVDRIKRFVAPEGPRRGEITDQEQAATKKMMEIYAGQLRRISPKVSTLIYSGDPKKIVLSEAEIWKADCIFVGARSLSSARRILIGGFSMAIAARAHCSVEVVRR